VERVSKTHPVRVYSTVRYLFLRAGNNLR